MRKQKFPESPLEAMKIVESMECGAIHRMLLSTAVAAHYQYQEIIKATGKPFEKLLMSDVVNELQKSIEGQR